MAKVKREQVENCAVLDINAQIRAGLFDDGCGAHVFDSSRLLEGVFHIFTPAVDAEERDRIWLFLTTWKTGEFKIFEPFDIGLDFSPAAFGGKNTWIKCPAEKDSHRCGARVRKLFLPPGSQFWGCRKCHSLAYRASQEVPLSEDSTTSDEEFSETFAAIAKMINRLDVDPAAVAALIGGLDTPENRRKRRKKFRELQVVIRRRASELAVYQGFAIGSFRHGLIVESYGRMLDLYDPERWYD